MSNITNEVITITTAEYDYIIKQLGDGTYRIYRGDDFLGHCGSLRTAFVIVANSIDYDN